MGDNPIQSPTRAPTQTPIQAYGAWLASVPKDWPEEALHSAHREFIDTIAVMIPGAREPVSKTVYALAKSWGEGHCSAVGFEAGVSAPMAAMVNGTSAHAIDFDDNLAIGEQLADTGVKAKTAKHTKIHAEPKRIAVRPHPIDTL